MIQRKRDYTVGFGKPPESTRFPKNRSGNPKGRPKARSVNGLQLLNDILDRQVPIRPGDPKRISLRRFIVRQTANKALQGNMKAIETLMAFENMTEAEDITKILVTVMDFSELET